MLAYSQSHFNHIILLYLAVLYTGFCGHTWLLKISSLTSFYKAPVTFAIKLFETLQILLCMCNFLFWKCVIVWYFHHKSVLLYSMHGFQYRHISEGPVVMEDAEKVTVVTMEKAVEEGPVVTDAEKLTVVTMEGTDPNQGS